MAKQYNWRARTSYQSTTTLSYGVNPSAQSNWQTANAGSMSGTWTYWYRDANVSSPAGFTDANSSRVAVSLTESWTATIDSHNNLTISVTSTINSLVRDDLRGTNQNTPGRNIDIYRTSGGASVLSLTDTQLASAHTIWSGPLVLDTYTFTLAPGQNLERNSLYLHNQTIGMQSYDDIWFGIQWRNPLPKDYRPGTALDTNTSIWKSHNRNNGACHILSNVGNMTWHECRTVGGDEGEKGDPPLILTAANANSWRNQKLLGKE